MCQGIWLAKLMAKFELQKQWHHTVYYVQRKTDLGANLALKWAFQGLVKKRSLLGNTVIE